MSSEHSHVTDPPQQTRDGPKSFPRSVTASGELVLRSESLRTS